MGVVSKGSGGKIQQDYSLNNFARGARVHILRKQIEPVRSDTGLAILPTMTLAGCPDLDLVCIPGGPVQITLVDDEEILAFVRENGARAFYLPLPRFGWAAYSGRLRS